VIPKLLDYARQQGVPLTAEEFLSSPTERLKEPARADANRSQEAAE
jgi:hypothetical protein